ncbi:MAG: hypothetical protein Kow0098_28220 [Ignavibacteriaceae bacterium]
MRLRKVKIFSLFFLFITEFLIAQGPPIFSDTPLMLGLEGRGIRTFGKFLSSENTVTYNYVLAVPYNVTTDLQIGLQQPYVVQSPEVGGTKSGFGNLSVAGKYSVIQIDSKAKSFRGLIKFTQTFSTGADELNSGITISQFKFVTGYVTTGYGLYSTIGYSFVSDDLPDNLIYDFTFGYPLLPQKFPPFQLNTYLEFNGLYTLDINEHVLFISPGLQLITTSNFLIEAGVQLPVIENNKTKELKYNLLVGIRFLFY